ncbi:MAG: ADP-forming succinate--CoA ligase subunit beta [Flammeovirgaceae bacterium TMED290]|nr:MAG: ADP-forming succinate--CoA ligase subunit beta [Flammeovirgaceae bacterium TMED290]|tara:strand:- start:7387 stop:8595 length:1209 start_codon:yes stop_codon:yes gene_type:complete
MNIHEYQAKEILKNFGVKIQNGFVAETPEDAKILAAKLSKEKSNLTVLKAQIHAGGRGKGIIKETGSNGVVISKSFEEVDEKSKNILGGTLVTHQTGEEGKKVNKLLIAEDVYYDGPEECKEYYLGILLDRSTGVNVIMASTEGGVDIEKVAEETPEKIIKEWIDPKIGLQQYQVRKIAFSLNLSGNALKEMIKFINCLYNAYESIDASLFEINPVLKTSDDQILAVDAKVNIDDNALYRQNDIENLRDLDEEDPSEIEANKSNLSYVKLDGNVGCMVNGAGLAMATMDMIKLSGGDPANFLDVGGTANAETVEAGFRIILKDPNVKAILLNIFGGIVRCDRVANGVVQAYKNIGEINVPIIVRLQGTNSEEGSKIIEDSGLKVYATNTLQEAADKVNEILS